LLKKKKLRLFNIRFLNFIFAILYKLFLKSFKLSISLPRPSSIFLWTTIRCSKDCVICPYISDLNKSIEAHEFNIEKFKGLFDLELFRYNFHIGFYGGEPFLCRDLFEMIKFSNNKGLITSVTTNGKHIQKNYVALNESDLDFITVSYYDDEYESLIQSLHLVSGPVIKRMSFILSKQTLNLILKALKLAIDSKFEFFIIEPESDICRLGTNLIYSDSIEFKSMRREVESYLKVSKSRINIRWPKLTKIPLKAPGCYFMWDTIYFKGDYKWAPCCQWQVTDYFDFKNFKWNGDWYQRQRLALIEGREENKFCKNCNYRYDSTMQLGL
jgi:MoaA/NifB/PqqE/SkfB family radical SAM enzyme